MRNRPLAGITVIEMAAIGPVPYCGMVLADMGAQVIRIDRTIPAGIGISVPIAFDIPARGKASVALDLKHEEAREALRRLIATADILLEGFRPGVMERLGLGPEPCLAANPRLIYGRLSGWGTSGPLADRAGHDINYLALSGALGAIGESGLPPPPPLNLVADYGGGALHLACGLLAALFAARMPGGQGQVVETSILQGTNSLMAMVHGLAAAGIWTGRANNILDGAAPYYRCYETADGGYLALGAIEPKFYAELVKGLGLEAEISLTDQNDRSSWPRTRRLFGDRISSKTLEAWLEIFSDRDACIAPVLMLDEVADHPQQRAINGFVDGPGSCQPNPGMAFSATDAFTPSPPRPAGADTLSVLAALGYEKAKLAELQKSGAIAGD